jgi:hypothetical protein
MNKTVDELGPCLVPSGNIRPKLVNGFVNNNSNETEGLCNCPSFQKYFLNSIGGGFLLALEKN